MLSIARVSPTYLFIHSAYFQFQLVQKVFAKFGPKPKRNCFFGDELNCATVRMGKLSHSAAFAIATLPSSSLHLLLFLFVVWAIFLHFCQCLLNCYTHYIYFLRRQMRLSRVATVLHIESILSFFLIFFGRFLFQFWKSKTINIPDT